MASLPEYLQSMPAGRDRLPREVMEEHQRDRVIAAAIEVFAKRGYPGTTVDHLVVAAKVGVGSFYTLFDGKEDCFLRAYDRIVSEGREQIAASLPDDGTWPERLLDGLRTLLELIEAEPFRARIALVEVQTAGAVALSHYEANLEQVSVLLRSGREHSDVAAELPATLEFATVGGLVWFLQQRIALGEAANATKLLPEVLEIVAEPYLGEAKTAELIAAA
jgi:AcrR family transcriptional regulator